MEKIVIRTVHAEPAPLLIFLLNRYFPECEIHIVIDAETLEFEDREDRSQNAFQEEKHGQYSGC